MQIARRGQADQSAAFCVTAKMTLWVKSGKARGEHIPSGLPPRADIVDALWHFRKVPKLVIAEIAAKQSWNCVRAWTGRP
jgi:hypothetical protein